MALLTLLVTLLIVDRFGWRTAGTVPSVHLLLVHTPAVSAMALTFPSFASSPASTSTFSFGSSSAFGNATSSAPAFPSFSAPSLGPSLFSSSSSAQSSFTSFPSFSFTNPASVSASQSSFGPSSLSFPVSSSAPASSSSPVQPLSLTSTYTSLPDDVRNVFLSLERHIRQQTTVSDELSASLPPVRRADAMDSVGVNVSGLSNALVELRVLMSEDMERVEAVQREVETDIRQAEGSHRRGMRLAHVGQVGQGVSHMHDTLYLPSHFHWQRLMECEKRLAAVRSEMADVESCLLSVHSSPTATSQQQDSLAALAAVLQSQHNSLVDVSSRISALHSHIDALRIARTARNPSTDDSRRLLTSALRSTLDSFGALTTTSPLTNAGMMSYAAPSTTATSFQPTSNATAWNSAPSVSGGNNPNTMFGTLSSSSPPPFSFSQSSFPLPSTSTAAAASSFGGISGNAGTPSLPTAPPTLTSSTSSTAESGQYRTIRTSGANKPVIRKK